MQRFAISKGEVLLSCVAYCGFAVFPSEEPFLPSPVVALPLEADDLFLHVSEHAFGFQASDHFLRFFCFVLFCHLKCVIESTEGVFCNFTVQLV